VQPTGRRRRAELAPDHTGNSHGVLSSPARSTRGVHLPWRMPTSSTFRLQGFYPLDGLLLPEPTRPCFMPEALLRFYPSGSSPSDEPHSFRSRYSLAVSDQAPTTAGGSSSPLPKQKTTTTEQWTATGPRDFGALLPSEVRSQSCWCFTASGPIPPWACAPLRLSPSRPGTTASRSC
jgi:hypothetical protein